MKKGLFALFLILSSYNHLSASKFVGDVTLMTQADVTAFGVVDSIIGNLTITADMMLMSDITTLAPLLGVKHVDGTLMIRAIPGLLTLSGLETIEVADALIIQGNLLLFDINALSKLSIVTGSVTISTNGALSQCCAIESAINPLIFINDAKNLSGCNSMPEIVADTSCDVTAILPAAVPTLGQWAIIHLGFLLLIIGMVAIQHSSVAIVRK